ncbi:MAG: helix-turn-helix domain-containing protein [Ferruginibacter sp.]|nr:helix-turn-helix domain-containing protein [Ferruginibacter sp.]
MSASTFKILKQCSMCSNMFEAQKVSTLYCSHKCNSRHYKLKKKLERKQQAEAPIRQPETFKPLAKAMNKAALFDKVFLSVKDIAVLFECSRKMVYTLIENDIIPAKRLSERKTLIKRSDIEKLFETPKKQQAPKVLKIEDCYTMEQLTNKYSIARNTIYGYVSKHNIHRVKEKGITYYSKTDIDNLFTV